MTYHEIFTTFEEPIYSKEGIDKIFDQIVKKQDFEISRKLYMDDKKHPGTSMPLPATENGELARRQAKAAFAILQRLKKDVEKFGVDNVYDYLSKIYYKYNPFTKEILTNLDQYTEQKIFELTIVDIEDNWTLSYSDPVLSKVCNKCLALGNEHNGDTGSAPYQIEGGYKGSEGAGYEARIYINTNAEKNLAITDRFLCLYIEKCAQRGLPFHMKGHGASSGDKDSTLLYSDAKHLPQHLEVLDEIAREHPELLESFGEPIATGTQRKGGYYAVTCAGSSYKRLKDDEIITRVNAPANDLINAILQNAFLTSVAKPVLSIIKINPKLNNTIKNIILQDPETFLRQFLTDTFKPNKSEKRKQDIVIMSTIFELLPPELQAQIKNSYLSEVKNVFSKISFPEEWADTYKAIATSFWGDAEKKPANLDLSPVSMDKTLFDAYMQERKEMVEIVNLARDMKALRALMKKKYPSARVDTLSDRAVLRAYIKDIGVDKFIETIKVIRELARKKIGGGKVLGDLPADLKPPTEELLLALQDVRDERGKSLESIRRLNKFGKPVYQKMLSPYEREDYDNYLSDTENSI